MAVSAVSWLDIVSWDEADETEVARWRWESPRLKARLRRLEEDECEADECARSELWCGLIKSVMV